MKTVKNICCDFSSEVASGVVPAITSFSSYPLKYGRKAEKSIVPFWAMEYHSKYTGKVILDENPEKQIERDQNSIHVFAPGCVRREDSRGADFPVQEIYFFYTGAEVCGIDKLISPEFRFARFYDSGNLAGGLFMRMAEYCARLGPKSFWMLQGLMQQIIFLLNISQKIDSLTYEIMPYGTEKQMSFSQKAELYMWKRLAKNITIKDIAAYMKTSESTFCHQFKKETGQSPINRLIELRIEFAKQHLMKGERLKTIAQLAGFCDEYHFSKRFKSVTGATPTQFRDKYTCNASTKV